ncbi:MAG: hypothetical protein ACKOES_04150, partial [Planctomycetaceae bacterium]
DAPRASLLLPPAGLHSGTPAERLARPVKPPVGMPSREDFTFSREASWVVRGDGSLVSLSGTSVEDRSRRPPLVIDIAAALATGSTLIHGGEP